jgi:DNA-binding CsgD family transcriptional regulator
MVHLSDISENKYKRLEQYKNSLKCVGVQDLGSETVGNKAEGTEGRQCPRQYPQYEDQTQIKHRVQRRQRWLTPSEVQQIIESYQNSAKVYELAAQFNCHRTTISAHLKRNGIQPSNKIKLDTKLLVDLYENGNSAAQIAEILNISKMSVLRYLHANGVAMR